MRSTLAIVFVAAAGLSPACGPKEPVHHVEQESPPEPQTPEPEPEGALQKAERGVTQHMPQHFADAHDMVDAVVAGDLDEAKVAAKVIADHRPDSMPADWWPYIKDMRAAANTVTGAESLDAAGAAAANVVLTCGRCHQDLGGGPKVPDVPAPSTDDERCMMGHRWATERLWLGLAIPSDEAWTQGSTHFVERPACAEALPEGPSHPDVFNELAKQLQTQAGEAAKATVLEKRAQAYGQMLSTCGNCHTSGC